MEEDHITRKVKTFVYLTHFFTTLGARMWWFGIGLFIIEVAPNSLQLTAIYGFSNGGALLLLSTLVGDLIDRIPRLKAARLALFLNNFGIALCCVVVFFVFHFRYEIETRLADEGLLKICFTLIIILTIFSNLCNLGRTLVMERDWIVEICHRNNDKIATMSATFRFIDLTTKALAPLVTGQLMTYASSIYGPIFIGLWNIFAFFIEYWLLGMVYRMNPRLHLRDSKRQAEFEMHDKKAGLNDQDSNGQVVVTDPDDHKKLGKTETSFFGKLFSSFISLYRGWSHYRQYSVALSGLSLAFLYFTVLGFDNITIGYAYSQGMTESILGILVGVSAGFGILASVLYPLIRKCVGVVNTGQIGLTFQLSCLTLCVVSLWLPGGTFGPPSDAIIISSNSSVLSTSNSTNITGLVLNSTELAEDIEDTGRQWHGFAGMSTSLIVLFTGIVGARFGVWVADLAIAQLFLESVEETERGLVNGFQSSLNKLMDMLKFLLVLFISDPSMFGYPAMVSYCCIATAWLLYTVYKKKTVGHVFCKICI